MRVHIKMLACYIARICARGMPLSILVVRGYQMSPIFITASAEVAERKCNTTGMVHASGHFSSIQSAW